MLFERFEVEGLAHYSYAVGCPAAGEAAIVDPERNVDRYLRWAKEHEVRIARVLETHIHADFASGARELAERTGAELLLSVYDDGELYEVGFEHTPLGHGDQVRVGSARLAVVHTPGHTPEHVSFLVYETTRSTEVPEILLSGDFLFVGSLGRPDLLGEEAKLELAHRMFRSVREQLAPLPDGLEVAPAHGAGSMCGAGMSGRPTSTLGFERIANPYLVSEVGEDDFVERLLASVPPFPPYYRRMKQLNAAGPPTVGDRVHPEPLEPRQFREVADRQEAVVVDLRDQLAFGGGHIPGARGIGGDARLSEWAAWLVPYDRPILLVDGGGEGVSSAARCLVRVGLDNIRGYLDGGMAAWREAGLPLAETPQVSVERLHRMVSEGRPVRVLDIRTDAEWQEGHIEGATHVHGGLLAESLEAVPPGDGPLVVFCGSGYRSTAVASLLESRGVERVTNVAGGMAAWKAAGLPLEGD